MVLPEIIAKKIAAATLERVVFDQAVIDTPQRTAIFKASGLSVDEIGEKVVRAYGSQSSRLAYGLYEQISDTDWKTAQLLLTHFSSGPETYQNHQASLVGRIPTLPLDTLSKFLDAVKKHVCLIVSRKGDTGNVIRGTGFLVAPDLVLTCRHVLKSFLKDDVLANGNRIGVYFDFHSGDPVEAIDPDLPNARRVELANNWYVESGDDTDPDGVEGDLTPEDAARIGSALDFILLRLQEPVGRQPIERGGGPRRGWIILPADAVPRSLAPQDWIIIPQHPNGLPQRIDLGRFRAADQTGTRIRYSTNTAKGSSGAPCFNEKFFLVGVHNAYVGPAEQPLANQAIRLDHVAALVRPHMVDASNDPYAPRWSIARANEKPNVILGRDPLLAWLRASAVATPRFLADRVYAAHATVPFAGCSFSSEILHAEIRDTKVPRAVYGKGGQQLPATAEDFLRSLIREMGIVLNESEPDEIMPERPGAAAQGGVPPVLAGEVDKLNRWLSEELPNWLGRLINKLLDKKIDAREAARQAVALYEQQGLEPPQEIKDNSTAADPILVRPNSWDFAYVVIDDLRSGNYQGTGSRTELKGEVQSLLAALIKAQPDSGASRLRWMFLGYLPDFIGVADADGNGATVEVLDPAATGVDDVVAMFDRMSQAYLRMQEEFTPLGARASARFVVRMADAQGSQEPRLVVLQRNASGYSEELLKEVGE